MTIPLDIKINKWLANLALIVAAIGLIFGIVSLFNDPIKNIKEYSTNTTENLIFINKPTKIQNINFFKIVSSGRRSTDTIKYHITNTGIDTIIMEYNSDNGEPVYSDKTYLYNSGIDAKEGDIQEIRNEAELPETTKIYRYTTESNIKSNNSTGFFVFGTGLVGFAVFRIRYWYYKKNLDQSIAYLNKTTPSPTSKIEIENTRDTNIQPLTQHKENQHTESNNPINPINVEQANTKVYNKIAYSALAFFFGVFGVHKFYSGNIKLGLVYLLWLPMLIISIIYTNGAIILIAFLYLLVIAIISIIEAIIALFR